MKKLRKKNTLSLVVLALLFGSFYLWQALRERQREAQENWSYAWQAGQAYRYHFEYSSNSSSDFTSLLTGQKSPEGLQNTIEIQFRGEWIVFPSVVEESQIKWIGHIRPSFFKFVFNSNEINEEKQALEKEISLPFLVHQSPQGEIKLIKFDSKISQKAKNFIKTWLARFQFVLPGPAQDKWEAIENELDGKFHFQYAKIQRPRPEQIRLKKSHKVYLPEKNPLQTRRSSMELDLSKNYESDFSAQLLFDTKLGIPLRLHGHEKQKIKVKEHVIGLSQHRFNWMRLTRTQPETTLAKQSLRPLEQSKADDLKLVEDSSLERQIQLNELGSMDRDEIFRAIRNAYKTKDAETLNQLYLKLKALIYLYPKASALLIPMLQEFDENSEAFQMVLRALGSNGHPEAQQAIMTAMQKTESTAKTMSYTLELATVKHPTPESENTLRKLIKDTARPEVVSSAGLGLGIMAFNLSESAPEREKQIVDEFLYEFDQAENQQQKSFVMSALGNSGSPHVLETVLKTIETPEASGASTELQAEAARSLRFIPGEHVTHKLTDLLSADKEELRESAAFALSFRPPTLQSLNAQMQAYQKNQSPQLKQELLRNVWEGRRIHQEIQTWMRELAQSEPDQDLRKLANELLNQ